MLINIIMNWANFVVYFDFPEWFTDFDSIQENEDDPVQVKAIKVCFHLLVQGALPFLMSCIVAVPRW